MKKLNLLIVLVIVLGVSLLAYTVSATSTPSFEVSENPSGGPATVSGTFTTSPLTVGQNENVSFSVGVEDVSGITSVEMHIINSNGALIGKATMYDDGITDGDTIEGDGVYSGVWNSGNKAGGIHNLSVKMQDRLGNYNSETSNDVLEITNPVDPEWCTGDVDCGTGERCCGNGCVVNECVSNTECTAEAGGTCNISNCPSVCEYPDASAATTPVITSSLNASGEEGPGFHYQIFADNTPTSFDAVGLPASLTVDTTTGIISGALDAGTSDLSPYNVTISATNDATVPTDSQTLVLTVTVPADTIAPIVSIISPADGTVFTSDTIIVKALATDNVGITQVAYNVNGVEQSIQQFEYDSLNNPGEYWETLVISPGVNTITAIASDLSNDTASAPISVELNMPNSAPVINAFMDVDGTGVQYVGEYDDADTIRFRSDSSDDGLVIQVEVYKNGGSGYLMENTPAVPASDFLITFGIGASTITYLDQAIINYAAETDNFKLPFIPVAKAEIVGNQNCTTTATTRDRQVYAVVYDDAGLSTTSGMVNVTINGTTTSCVNLPSSSTAS